MADLREIHLEERPRTLKQVVGQQDACRALQALAKSDEGLPHCILFSGPSGCGKTTLARILRNKLKCSDADFAEVNAAENRGIEMVRTLQSRVGLSPIGGESRVWLIDECHQLTADAQGAFLKLLEEPPDHVYFMLCTTHPEKMRKAIQTRCTEIKVTDLSEEDIQFLVKRITDERGVELSNDVITKLAEVSEGSARKALVLLQQVAGIDDEKKQLNLLQNSDAKAESIEIARAIMGHNPSWSKIAALIKACKQEPESIRWLILSYFTTVSLGGRDADRAVAILECFQDNYYDTKKAGLVISCYNAHRL